MQAARPTQVYQGGSAAGVECFACGASSTSGSWRRLWETPGGHLNGCNKCGQRWQKAGRPASLEELHAAEARKAAARPGGGPASGSPAAAPSAGIKRPAPTAADAAEWGGRLSPSAAAAAAAKRARPVVLLPPPRPRRLFDDGEEDDEEEGSLSSPTSSADTLTPSHNRPLTASLQSTAPVARPPLAPRPQHAPPRLQPQQQQAQAEQQGQAAVAAKPAAAVGSASFLSYTVQKLSSNGRANHAAFWLQSEGGDSELAVVGIDARMSGHFTYTTTPSFLEKHPGIPPLRCTNRAEVQAWLAAFGCTTAVDPDSVRLPDLSAEERRRLLNPEEPVWSKPSAAALQGSWRGVREESGRLTDGRHFKRFWLLPAAAGGQEKLVVTGVDSPRKDRRYRYFAEDEMGGFAFENAREVMAWCNHILARPTSAPLEAEQVRLARPLREEELGSRILERLRALSQQERQPPTTTASRPSPTSSPSAAAAAGPAAPAARAAAGSSPAAGAAARAAAAKASPLPPAGPPTGSPYAACLGGKVRPVLSPQLLARGGGGRPEASGGSPSVGTASAPSSRGEDPSQEHEPAAVAGPVCSPAFPATLPPSLPPPPPAVRPRPVLSLRCATCGLTTHPTDDCPLAICSPPSLIRPAGAIGAHRTISLLLPSDPAFRPSGSPGGSTAGEEAAWQLPPSPQMLSTEQLHAQLLAGQGDMGGSGSGDHQAAAAALGGSKPVSADVQRRFSAYPQLLTFVRSLPSAPTKALFEHYAERLTAHISDVPPPLPQSENDAPVGGWRWTPTSEALAILRELSVAHVNLSLLETTGIAGAVAQLRNHVRNPDIAAVAEVIVQRWRTAAVAALTHATGGAQPPC